jgi:hypothetical protein
VAESNAVIELSSNTISDKIIGLERRNEFAREAMVAEFISPIAVISELFWVTKATTACGSPGPPERAFCPLLGFVLLGDKDVLTGINRLIGQRHEIAWPQSPISDALCVTAPSMGSNPI